MSDASRHGLFNDMLWSTSASGIEIQLPITAPTSKVRVKRPVAGALAVPVPCCSKEMDQQDYLEWQISYDTPDLENPSIVNEVKLNKPQGVRFGCELVRLIVEARRLNYLPDSRWQHLRQQLNAQLGAPGIEETEGIASIATHQNSLACRLGFQRTVLQVPVFLKSTPHYAIEVKIGAKQRAVGLQAMIFVHLPIAGCTSKHGPLPGRKAVSKESAGFTINQGNADLIHDTTLAFVLASRTHARDIDLIFQSLGL